MPSSVSRLVALACCAIGTLAAAAPAVASVQGSPLSSPANYPYGCETRWMFPGPGQTAFQPMNIGPSTCTVWQPGATIAETFLVPGSGTVLSARVKSGPNPAPISIATVRRYFKPNAQGQMEYTCCQGISETPVINPTPNAITEIPVNLIVLTQQPENGNTGYWDIVAVNSRGTGTLPISDLGPHEFGFNSTLPSVDWFFPAIAPNDSNQNDWNAPNFEVLMQYDWCPKIAGTRAQVRAACPSGAAPAPTGPAAPGPAAPGTPNGPASTGRPAPKPATVTSTALRLKGSAVRLSVTCAAAARCTGTARLRTTSKKLLASKRVTIKAGKKATVTLKLGAKDRRRVTKKGIKVVAEIDLGKAGKVTRTLTLKR